LRVLGDSGCPYGLISWVIITTAIRRPRVARLDVFTWQPVVVRMNRIASKFPLICNSV